MRLPGSLNRKKQATFGSDERGRLEKQRYYSASQWQLMWLRFRRHRLAMTAGPLLAGLYLAAIFCPFVAPYYSQTRLTPYLDAPPQGIHFFSREGGRARLQGPFVYGLKEQFNPDTFRRSYIVDPDAKCPVRFFVKGEQYTVLGLFRSSRHLFGGDACPIFLFGTDVLGRDIFSRIFYGARISLSIGLVGILLSFVLGLSLGGISGYFGGIVDEVIQRIIDVLKSIPTLPLWMALSAALPRDWPIIKVYFAISIIFSIVGWTGLARVTRGKLLALREEDFATAAKVAGAGELRIVVRHLLPLFLSYIIVSLTTSIPGMILGETSLSFIGLGLQPPAVSWGVLLKDAQSLVAIAHQPWKLIPGLFVVATILLFNFLGDGLRDAADPYST